MKGGIRAKLFLSAVGLITIAVGCAELYLSATLEQQLSDRIRADLLTRVSLVAHRVASAAATLDDRSVDALADELGAIAGARVTFVRPDGTVAGDSEVGPGQLPSLENHGNRPEVISALAEGRGTSVRFSATVGSDMMYAAVPIVRQGVTLGTARIALPLTEVDAGIANLRRALAVAALLALAIAAIAAYAVAQVTSRRLELFTVAARRMAAGELSARTRSKGSDEIAALGQALDHLAASLARSLEHLRAERDLLTGILSSMSEGVLVLGSDARVALTNPALREMLLIGTDAVGKSVLEVVRNSELNELLRRAAHGDTVELEIELAGIIRRRVLVRAVRLAPAPSGVLAVVVDVTRLRNLETVRRDFVTNASHELRSPLTSIRAAAETLHTLDNDADASAHMIELIERNADRLANLIDDLLALSRIESRELHLELEPLDLRAAVDRVLQQHAHRAEVKAITMRNEISPALRATADKRAFDHVLGNLIDNALKYCAEGAAIRVNAVSANGSVRVAVSDTGPGIPAEHLPRLFERFYRINTGRSRELGGTGLGLSIVKHLVEALGGEVAVESRTGVGTTFSFTLPKGGVPASAGTTHV